MMNIIGKLMTSLVLSICLLGMVAPAQASYYTPVFFDDFNDNDLDIGDWTCEASRGDFTVVSPDLWVTNINDRLEFNFYVDSDDDGEDDYTWASGATALCNTAINSTGEAEFEVDYHTDDAFFFIDYPPLLGNDAPDVSKYFEAAGEYEGVKYRAAIVFTDEVILNFSIGVDGVYESFTLVNHYKGIGPSDFDWSGFFHLKLKRNSDGTFTATIADEANGVYFEETSTTTIPLDAPLHMILGSGIWRLGIPEPVWYDNAKTTVPPLIISIDIKPGSDLNNINLKSSGVIPVAIFSSDTFDATKIAPETVTLAGASVKKAGKAGKYLCNDEDVNEDGLLDKVCKVYTAEFVIGAGESIAVLEAETFDGTPVRGEDTIRIVPNK